MLVRHLREEEDDALLHDSSLFPETLLESPSLLLRHLLLLYNNDLELNYKQLYSCGDNDNMDILTMETSAQEESLQKPSSYIDCLKNHLKVCPIPSSSGFLALKVAAREWRRCGAEF